MSEISPTVERPRRWWLAFLLNLFLLPAGYAYVQAWRWALGALALIVVASFALTALVLNSPSAFYALYALGTPALLAIGVLLQVSFAMHAALLSRHAPPRSGSRLRHAASYAGAGLLGVLVSQGLWALTPYATYSVPSASMNPTVEEGDVVIVRGARALCGRQKPVEGQVIISRQEGVHYIRRAVAGPGRTVAMVNGALFIDGEPVARRKHGEVDVQGLPGMNADVFVETHPGGPVYSTLDFGPDAELDNVLPFVVPAGSWYLLGDSRDNASDSRVHGPVAEKDICAVVLKTVFSKDKSRVGQTF